MNSSGSSPFPLLVLVPARTVHEETPLFLEKLGGTTILDWTLEDAERQAERGDVTLVVTTDDPRIEKHVAARDAGWQVRMREAEEISGGYFHALETAADWAAAENGKPVAAVLILEPSHPFRPAGLISNAVSIFENSAPLDTVVAVVREYGNLWTESNHGDLGRIHTPEGRNFFREVAGLCLLSRPQCLNRTSAMGKNVGFVVVEEQWALIDIHGGDGVIMAQRFHDFLTEGTPGA